jgi:hypothetical protein
MLDRFGLDFRETLLRNNEEIFAANEKPAILLPCSAF